MTCMFDYPALGSIDASLSAWCITCSIWKPLLGILEQSSLAKHVKMRISGPFAYAGSSHMQAFLGSSHTRLLIHRQHGRTQRLLLSSRGHQLRIGFFSQGRTCSSSRGPLTWPGDGSLFLEFAVSSDCIDGTRRCAVNYSSAV
jgi:hypothetical protein